VIGIGGDSSVKHSLKERHAREALAVCLLEMFDYVSCSEWMRGENQEAFINLIDEIDVQLTGHLSSERSLTDDEASLLRRFKAAFDAAIEHLNGDYEPRKAMSSAQWLAAVNLAREMFLAIYPWVSRRSY
jgi:hypothetical protein